VSTYPAGVVPPHGTNRAAVVSLSAGSHAITIVAAIPENGYYPINLPVPIPVTSPVTFRFTWSRLGDTIASAVAAARAAKVALVFADDNGASDSDIINSLAANQDALIQAVTSANPNTVVVLSTGDPVLMPWLNSVKGVLEMWYPGQEGGTSTAKLLLGQANPGGRLPITWPANDDQTPFAGHPERINGDGTEVPFSEGIYVGYRWYDQQNINPLFCFGYGLSYTTFRYSGLKIKSNQGGLEVSFTVQNTGNVQGSEVPQVYVGPPSNLPGPIQVPAQKLVGFDRVNLSPGQKQHITVQVSPLDLSYWSSQEQEWVLGTGKRTIHVGGSSRDIQLQGQAVVPTPQNQN
jgi:beta-glucosidase